MTTTLPRRTPVGWAGACFRAMAPWLLLLVGGKVILTQLWSPLEVVSSLPRWLSLIVDDLALALPFVLFAVGLALGRVLGHSGRAFRVAVLVGLSVSILSYGLDAWVEPGLEDRILVARGAEADTRQFGSQTPVGILRNLVFVETNPPPRYSLETSSPQEFPPNVLLWRLHQPLALAVFGIANVLLGLLASELTIDLSNRVRRNVRLAIGVGGGIAFLVGVVGASPVEAFLRDGTMRSGIAGAWLPLLIPLIEGLVLRYLVTRRRYG
ncbi:MAG: hypothetical protein OXI83_10395 [Gemmatimonadota bacterium]|nr:hypothetical protein [Gemmatimonadota bacterium]